MEQVLARINKLSGWKVAIVIALVGVTVFCIGLTNPFLSDDQYQIVNNPVVHSLSHLRIIFESSTFYNGNGTGRLSGLYYRPLMMTSFAVLYSLLGPHPVYFHILQLALFIAVAILVFLFFRYFFGTLLATVLAMIYMLHPVNSQLAYAIPTLQDVLFIFFGMLAMWLLVRIRSSRSLVFVCLSLFMSLLSKESGVLFVAMALLYLFCFDRKRIKQFIAFMALPVVIYAALKLHAVGLGSNPDNAPIDRLSFAGRLLTIPSIGLFYVTKFIFPLKLASAYHWVYPAFSIRHVLLPAVIDVGVISLLAYIGFVLYRRASKDQFFTYLFFAIWTVLGILPYLQISPLDMTVSETWFYFPMAGVLGMVGVCMLAAHARIRPGWFIGVAIIVLVIFGVRTALRGLDWRSQDTLAYKDIAASKEDYSAYDFAAQGLLLQNKFNDAKAYALTAVNIYPNSTTYETYGLAAAGLGDYPGAMDAFNHSLHYGGLIGVYEDVGAITLLYGNPVASKQFFFSALRLFPHDSTLWLYFALFEDKYYDIADARDALTRAATYGQVPQGLYTNIINGQPFTLTLANLGSTVAFQKVDCTKPVNNSAGCTYLNDAANIP